MIEGAGIPYDSKVKLGSIINTIDVKINPGDIKSWMNARKFVGIMEELSDAKFKNEAVSIVDPDRWYEDNAVPAKTDLFKKYEETFDAGSNFDTDVYHAMKQGSSVFIPSHPYFVAYYRFVHLMNEREKVKAGSNADLIQACI